MREWNQSISKPGGSKNPNKGVDAEYFCVFLLFYDGYTQKGNRIESSKPDQVRIPTEDLSIKLGSEKATFTIKVNEAQTWLVWLSG